MNSLGFNKENKDTKVVVAMSGGVDSSVVACLLKEQGYDVIGITLQLYDIGDALKKKNACCAGVDIMDAKKVAEKFGFPHYVLNYQNLFKESVIDDFADSYLQGETPIPCVKCNQSVKFRDLMKVAFDLGADALATGHYVQRIIGKNGEAQLHKAADDSKDQSYFLFATTKEQLDFLRFPLGDLTKEETRDHAKRLGLPVSDKPDSQDICFVPEGGYAEVVKKLRPDALDPGEIIHIDGRVLGHHQGIIHFTVGQRKGVGVSAEVPLFVIKVDAEKKQVIVGPKEALAITSIRVINVNWLTCFEGECEVKLRSAHHPIEAFVMPKENNTACVTFKEPQYGVAPGQACVFYHGTRVLGGGWIELSC